jgi:superfamily II DNA or RNA helicase/HKD family nuclease/SOS-response transcriptional repressor LexA
MDKSNESFNSSLQTGFVDKSIESETEFHPDILVNQKKPPRKVLSTILEELEKCDEFFISVAFVTTSGVATIINKLKELEHRKIKGKVLVSQYLNFTQPEALRRLMQFENIDLRIATKGNAHAKGYIFKNQEFYNLIVGSSNLTAQALTVNKEWNLKVSARDQSGLVEKVLNEFQADFQNGSPVTEQYITKYEEIYEKQFLLNKRTLLEEINEVPAKIVPNSMQKQALKNLDQLRLEKKNKALIISATGTGKTYLSAFDAMNFGPRKLLFVVHRLTIAMDAMNTFSKVFGKDKTMGLYSGNKRELECDFLFSTIQTISKESHLNNFSKDHFDYIIIDESHRSKANSYLRLHDYFEPKFLLGMTATPERTDAQDIFELFDHNIAYEIRLHKAMEEDMLSSFHYFGVSELTIDDESIEDIKKFNLLVSEERVDRIIEHAKFYGSDNGITRGLIFCSRKDEAIELSNRFNDKGYKTVALTGDSSEEKRAEAIEKLESDNLSQKLDYILTVDIFNEGIDIPKINQIIMLRPTDSAIVFIQQFGRGLRKTDGKTYLTVIDFIGNHNNNFLIPIALYGDTSYNKDSLRKLLTEGSRMIPGASTINFDEITKEKIFESIDSANMQLFADLKKDYLNLKYKLGRIPLMMDFIDFGSRDPYLFVNQSNSYYSFVIKVEKENIQELPSLQVKILELFAKEINNSKRVEESIIIDELIRNGKIAIKVFKEKIFKKYHYSITNETINSCVSNLNFEFIREKKDKKLKTAREIYNLEILKIDKEYLFLSDSFKSYLKQETFKIFLLDSISYSTHEFDKEYDFEKWQNGFVLYRKYSRKDVFRILNAQENPVAQNVGGYLVSPDHSNCPIFVNYHKEDHISESTKYEDEFVNKREFDWMSKSNRKLTSNDVQSILGKHGPIRLPLFIKKNNDEGKEFYYMGDMNPEKDKVEQSLMKNDKGKNVSVVKIRFSLSNPVPALLYNYLQEKRKSKTKKPQKKFTKSPAKQIAIDFSDANQKTIQIPLYDFHAAAGNFSDMQEAKHYSFIDSPANLKNPENYFACKVIGESMNRRIPNGSKCLFRKATAGSRNGKIVLVELLNVEDRDFESAFTVKTYSSEKIVTDEGWKHKAIHLRPNSYDESYKDIVITEANADGLKIVGEFVRVLD